ncbi:hypothetical protein [Thalassoglobus polymorphus]|uniref:hypothetical protein n=1 Tax=Thalassoglobus polymorphus TaxID=2527994 RepID=UPI0011A77E20|nr:hypothetical protein [Thalassoglobus polymorphus]
MKLLPQTLRKATIPKVFGLVLQSNDLFSLFASGVCIRLGCEMMAGEWSCTIEVNGQDAGGLKLAKILK